MKTLKNEIIKFNVLSSSLIIILISVILLLSLTSNLNSIRIKSILDKSYEDQVYIMKKISTSKDVDKRKYLKKMIPSLLIDVNNDETVAEIVINDNDYVTNYKVSKDMINAFEGMKSYSYFFDNQKLYVSLSSPIYSENGFTIGIIRYTHNMLIDYSQLYQLVFIIISTAILNIILVFYLSTQLSKRILNPITRLQKDIDKAELGNFAKHIKLDDLKEFYDLGSSYNKMIDSIIDHLYEIKKEKTKQNNFFNRVTHNLKSPLTSIIGYADLIEKISKDNDINSYSKIIGEEGLKQLSYIEELLTVSKINYDMDEVLLEYLNLDELVKKSIVLFEPIIKDNDIEIKINSNVKEIYSNKRYIMEILIIIIENALIHSNCSSISIETSANIDFFEINIEDNGIGIADKDIDKITDIFYRAHKDESIGSGVGLFTAASMIKALDGYIQFRNVDNGFRVVIVIPNVTEF